MIKVFVFSLFKGTVYIISQQLLKNLYLIKTELDINVFCVFKTVYFLFVVLCKSDMSISCFRNIGEIKHTCQRVSNDVISQIKVSRILLLIRNIGEIKHTCQRVSNDVISQIKVQGYCC